MFEKTPSLKKTTSCNQAPQRVTLTLHCKECSRDTVVMFTASGALDVRWALV